MKYFTRFFALFFVLMLVEVATSQPWKNLLPQEKADNTELCFYDYQKAFNDYWEPFHVEKGYYINNQGVKTKAHGWKQFKRWEWYWENRVDKVTGEFPTTSTWDIYREEKSRANKSLAGNWTSMGPTYTGGGYAGLGRINSIAFHPTNNNIIYIGAASGGIWKTSNGGTNWIPLGDDNAALGVSDIIVIENGASETIYLATGDKDHSDTYSIGVLKSTNGGTTWQTTGLDWTANQQRLVYRLLIDPSNQNLLYAATSNGFYMTNNAGTTWTQLVTTDFVDVEFEPANSTVLYSSDNYGKIYKSTNSGVSWSEIYSISGGARTELAVTADNPNVIYALAGNTINSGLKAVYKSTNNGASFTKIFDSYNLLGWNCDGDDYGGQAWYDLCIAADPNDANTVFVGGVNTWKSVDGGISWDISSNWASSCGGTAAIVHADKHTLVYRNGTSVLFEGNDGGIYKTENNGSSWSHIGNTLAISQMYRISCAQTNNTDVMTGLQDNGSKLHANNGWTDVYGGDGMECIIDFTNDNTQYASLYYGDVFRTTNKWVSSYPITNSISGDAAWVTPYTLDPNDHNTIYIGFQDVWKSINQGSNWIQISTWGGNTLQSLAIAPSNSSYIYAGTYNTLYGTTNGGGTWSNITGSLPVGTSSITYVWVKHDDPSTLWVTMSGFNNLGVFESSNGGSTWTNISTGLPEIPVNSIIQNKQNTTEVELYAATDVGVYLKLGTSNWVPFFNGLPNVVVNELDIYYDDVNPENSSLRAGTFGRGLWESDLYSNVATPPTADFIADYTTVVVNDIVTFTDLSTGTMDSWSWTFGDGNSSTDQNPTHAYTAEGVYTVSLTVSGTQGSDTETKTDYIAVTAIPAPVADFEATPLTGTEPLEVTFTDLTTGDVSAWSWDFGDGTQSTDQNPVHTYATYGVYTVSLTATGPGGDNTNTKTDYITVVAIPPVADFEATPITGNAPLFVSFNSLSTGEIYNWIWDLGNGGEASGENVFFTYNDPGYYTITLTVTGPGGTDVMTKTDYIEVFPANPPVVDFSATPTFGEAPLQVTFTNLTTGEVDQYDWSFGDGGASQDEHPVHEYVAVGNYTVALTATGPGGTVTETKVDYILIPVGIDNETTGAYIVYPNPVTHTLQIQFPDKQKRDLILTNVAGNQLFETTSEELESQLDMSKYKSGIYWLTIREKGETVARVKVIRK
jgi:PKD repeat protein